MVSYLNTLPYTQNRTNPGNFTLNPSQTLQWHSNYPDYRAPYNHQYFGSNQMDPHAHQMYYNAHGMFHATGGGATTAAAAAAAEWHTNSPGENFPHNPNMGAHQLMQQQQQQQQQQHQHHTQHHHSYPYPPFVGSGSCGLGAGGGGGGTPPSCGGSPTTTMPSCSSPITPTALGPALHNTQINAAFNIPLTVPVSQQQQQQQQRAALPIIPPSPPITVNGSELSSPSARNSSTSPQNYAQQINNNNNNNNNSSNNNNNNNNNSPPINSSNGVSNPSSLNNSVHSANMRASPLGGGHQFYEWMKKPSYPAQPPPGKTRTKDKYRVVYTDYQRLELEKEYCTSHYINIRRKSELAQQLSLSDRQVKIWFQNRRAKERKQAKKSPTNSQTNVSSPNMHFQHSLHSTTSSMAAMSMTSMRLHPYFNPHPALAHQFHQTPHAHAQMSATAAAVASVGSLSM